MVYDLVIIGMGPAGMSAAINAIRLGAKVLMIEKYMPGGLLNYTDNINNYLGFPNINGTDLAMKMMEHVKALEVPFVFEEVLDIKDEGELKRVVTNKNEYKTSKIIIATGRSPKRLNVLNEDKLMGNGLSFCAVCDGPLYKGRDVIVVGRGGNALEEALFLSNICNKVYVITDKTKFYALSTLIESVSQKENIEMILDNVITKINLKNNSLCSVTLASDEEIEVSGIFVFMGYEPKTEFAKSLNITDKDGYIKVNERFETSVNGIYAVGDITKKEVYQIVTAVCDGANAVISIFHES